MNTILAIVMHLYSGETYDTFNDLGSHVTCEQSVATLKNSKFTAQAMEIGRAKGTPLTSVEFLCISKERQMEMQDGSEQ